MNSIKYICCYKIVLMFHNVDAMKSSGFKGADLLNDTK
jgi:hypothetical protein